MFRILALLLDFEGAKTIYVLKVLIWDFGGGWRFLTWVWHVDLYLDMVSGLGIAMIQILPLSVQVKLRKVIGRVGGWLAGWLGGWPAGF